VGAGSLKHGLAVCLQQGHDHQPDCRNHP
jgi:hypothetical protein